MTNYYDYHVHTQYSDDCEVHIEKMIQGAIDKGIKEIAITDHIDYDYPDRSIGFILDFPNYSLAIDWCKQKYANEIKILKGVEVGIQHHIVDQCNDVLKQYDFDFIICSIHAAYKQDLHTGEFFENRTSKEAYVDYYKYYLECIQSFKHFNILGHLNLIDRYKHYIDEPVEAKEYMDIIAEIFKLLISEGKGIEINASSKRYKMDMTVPTFDMLKLYKDLGGEIITYGSDSHSPSTLITDYDETIEIMKSIGFEYITTFDKMRPIMNKI